MRVLVTGLGGPAGAALARQLLARGHEVIGTDIVSTPHAGLAAVFELGPRADSSAHLPFLRELAARTSADLLVPTVQDELLALAIAAPTLGIPVVISSPAAVGLAHDKLLTAWALSAAGVAVPDTRCLEDTSPLPFPYVVKPRVSRGGRGVVVVDGPEALPEADPRMVAQEFAPGTEYAPQLYRSPHTGESRVVVLEKTQLKQGRVGNAAAVRRIEEPDVAALAASAVVALGLTGPVDMDIRRRMDGTPVVLEVNARFGANSEHAPELVDAVLAEVAPTPVGVAV